MSARALVRIVPDPEENPEAAVAAACAIACVTGCLQLLMGICRLGVLAVFLAPPLVSGFTTAAAFAIAASQLHSLLGIQIPSFPDEEAGILRTYAVRMHPHPTHT
jgi:MFS superfamily sulfate permease-like transporter